MSTQRVIETAYGPVRLGTFREVLPVEGGYLNDHCLVRHAGGWHLLATFGIAGRQQEVSFLHAVAEDLHGPWQMHDEVLRMTGRWPEVRHVFAPFVFEHAGVFYMYYGGLDELGCQRICLATSEDLYRWQRYAGNPIVVPSLYWARWPGFGFPPDGPVEGFAGSIGGCRDPHVIRLADGRFAMYWVARMQERFGKDLLCVAASVSHDLLHWQEVGPIFTMKAWHQPLTLEVESPCVVAKDGRYWLFFKHGWGTYFAVSDDPFDFHSAEAVRLGYAHAAEVFEHDGRWWITHCKTDPDDYDCSRSDVSRGLFVGNLDWPAGNYPRLL